MAADLPEDIDAFMRHRFGPRSEQLDPDQLQLGLEDREKALAEVKAADEAKDGKPRSDRPRKANRGSPHLPTGVHVRPHCGHCRE